MTKTEVIVPETEAETERDRLIELARKTNVRLTEFVDRVTAALNSPVLGLSITAQRRITGAADDLKESIAASVTLHEGYPSDFYDFYDTEAEAELDSGDTSGSAHKDNTAEPADKKDDTAKPADKPAEQKADTQKPADKLV